MANLSPSLRRAAVLIAALDEATAEAILQQMSADDAAKVRSASVEISDIPPDEQEQVLAAFLKEQNESESAAADQDDVSLELDPEVEAAAARLSVEQPSPSASPLPTEP